MKKIIYGTIIVQSLYSNCKKRKEKKKNKINNKDIDYSTISKNNKVLLL